MEILHPGRRSTRLVGFDYSTAGAYFVTIVTAQRRCCLSEVEDGAVRLLPAGALVTDCWLQLPAHFPGLLLDLHVAMPNHLHGIVILPGGNISLPRVVQSFKSAASRLAVLSGLCEGSLWQRGYHDHVIRDEEELMAYRQYILDNPRQWELDRENPIRRIR